MPGPRDGAGNIREVGSRSPVNRNPRFPAFPFLRQRRCKSMYSTNKPMNVLPNKMRGVRGKGRRRYLSRPLFPIRGSSAKNPPGTSSDSTTRNEPWTFCHLTHLPSKDVCISPFGKLAQRIWATEYCSYILPRKSLFAMWQSRGAPFLLCHPGYTCFYHRSGFPDPFGPNLCYDVTRRHHGPNC